MQKYLVYLIEEEYVNSSDVKIIFSDADKEELQKYLDLLHGDYGYKIIAYGNFEHDSELEVSTINKVDIEKYHYVLNKNKEISVTNNVAWYKISKNLETELDNVKEEYLKAKQKYENTIYLRFTLDEHNNLSDEYKESLLTDYKLIKPKKGFIRYQIKLDSMNKLLDPIDEDLGNLLNKQIILAKEIDELRNDFNQNIAIKHLEY